MDPAAWLSTAGEVPGWAYLLLFAVTATPLVPNSSLVVVSGALAGQGRMSLAVVALVVLAGTLLGDHLLYGAVRWAGHRTAGLCRRAVAPRLGSRLDPLVNRVSCHVHRNGTAVLVTLRFVPCGRATGSLAAALGRYPVGRYAGAMLMAETAWTALYVGVGFSGGKMAPGPFVALGTALAMCSVVGLVGVLIRHRRARSVRRGQVSVNWWAEVPSAVAAESVGRP